MDALIQKRQELNDKKIKLHQDYLKKAKDLTEIQKLNSECFQVAQEFMAKQLELIETTYLKRRLMIERNIKMSQEKYTKRYTQTQNKIEIYQNPDRTPDISHITAEIAKIDSLLNRD